MVTGGAGFIGSHLIDRLIAQGHLVICLDNLSTGTLENLTHLESEPRFSFHHHDICKPIDFAVEEVYNLACPASPKHYKRLPLETSLASSVGLLNMLNLAKQHGAKLFHASTSEVYGDALVHPQHEGFWGNVDPTGPRACYAESKRFAETLATEFQRNHAVDIRIARIFNSYGPRLRHDDGRVVVNFISQALSGEPLTIFGDGSQTRSFCYVSDTVDSILGLMNAKNTPSSPVNIGRPNETSIRELADMVIAMTGSSSRLELQSGPHEGPSRRQPDITLAKTNLDWAPSVDLETGLAETIAFFRNSQKPINCATPESSLAML